MFGLALMLALVPSSARAQGGPPLITDDPDTPGPGYWEINVSTILKKSEQGRRLEAPHLDFNYGVGRRIQLKFEVPWLEARDKGGPLLTGAGDSVAGVKWRFLGQEGQKLAWSVYPQFQFTTDYASAAKGLVDEGRQLLLPTEITLEVMHAEFNVEIGRNFIQNGKDQWLYGISTEGHVLPRLELLAELHAERTSGSPTELIVNAGARQKLTRQWILMLAAGHAVHGVAEERPHLLFFAGLQLNLPGLYRFDQPDPGAAPARPRRRQPDS